MLVNYLILYIIDRNKLPVTEYSIMFYATDFKYPHSLWIFNILSESNCHGCNHCLQHVFKSCVLNTDYYCFAFTHVSWFWKWTAQPHRKKSQGVKSELWGVHLWMHAVSVMWLIAMFVLLHVTSYCSVQYRTIVLA